MGNINQKPSGTNADQESLINKETSSWDITSHALNIAPGTEDQVQGFKNKSKLFICSKTIQLTRKYDYTHFFVTDKKIVLELVEHYTCGASISKDYKVNISDFIASDDMVEEAEFRMNNEVRKRMLQVVGPGNFNFSLAFRNSEHVARYIHSGAWISRQMTQDSMTNDSIRRIFDSHMSDEQKKLINTPPTELTHDEEGSMEVIHSQQTDHVTYEQQNRLILSDDKDAQNIIFIGPTGCGKSNLVNQLYNKKVVISKASASSVTRKMQFTQGHYNGQKCNIVDTIGLCDTVLSETEVFDLIKDSIRANLVYIDKVVIVCSGRIEPAHKAAIKNIMYWLDYEHNKENFVFLYNKCDGHSEDTRQKSLVIMCEECGADIYIEQTIISPSGSSLSVKCVQALGLKPGLELSEVESDLTNFRRILVSEPTSRINVKVPITRDKTDILAFSKQKKEKEKGPTHGTEALLQQKEDKIRELTTALSKQNEEKEKEVEEALLKQKDEMEQKQEPTPGTVYKIQHMATARLLFLGNATKITKRGTEGGWLQSPSILGSDKNYYNGSLWTVEKRTAEKWLIIHQESNRLLLLTGESGENPKDIREQRGSDDGWLSANKVVGSDQNYYGMGYWKVVPLGQNTFLIEHTNTGRYLMVDQTIRSGGEGGWSEAPKVLAADDNYYGLAVWKFVS